MAVIGFESGSTIVNESDGTAEVCVVLVDGVLQRTVTFLLRTLNNTALGKGNRFLHIVLIVVYLFWLILASSKFKLISFLLYINTVNWT